MDRLTRLQLRQSELRIELGELLDLETRDTEQEGRRDAIGREMRSLERDIRDARLTQPPEPETEETPTADAETRELANLERRSGLLPMVQTFLAERPLDGANREYRQALLGDADREGLIPFEMLLTPASPPLEQRQDVVSTVAAAALVEGSQASVLERVFTRSLAARLGVAMPSVPVGDANFPVLTGGTTAAQVGAGEGHDAAAAAFAGFTLEPKRLSARYVFRIEDAARLRNYESILRRDLTAVMTDQMDNKVINGDPSVDDDDPSGFLAELVAPAAEADANTWTEYLTKFTALVDGINSYSMMDLFAVLGSDTFQFGSTLFDATANFNAPRASATEYVGGMIAGQVVSSRIPDGSDNTQVNIVAKRAYPGRNAVAPVWRAFELVRDPYTRAGTGEVILTARMLWNFKVIREAGWALIAVRNNG